MTQHGIIRNGPIRMDLVSHQAFVDDEYVKLSPREYQLLELFLTNPGKLMTHRQILTAVWGPAHADDIQYLRVYLGQIRTKFAKWPPVANCITSEPRVGYRMEDLAGD